MATLGRLMSLLSPFDVVIWMTDGWPLYESRLKESCTLSASVTSAH
jgi:insertion element IS1 protein InsB